MKKKVIYGEYTLLHWIELILRKNVVLPKYQRHFVWEDDRFNKFVTALKNGNFIPPVIIGAFDGENIILDGQQRLTSVLLSYLGYMPKREDFKTTDLQRYVDASDYELQDENAEPIAWTINVITGVSENKTKADILSNVNLSKYKALEDKHKLTDDELNNIYLGFSYIVPEETDSNVQQRFYSTVFRDINQQRAALLGQESRRSLYYMDSELEDFFDPEISRTLKLKQNSKTVQFDFVRALAFLAQYTHDGNENSIAKKCRSQEKLEIYYENFINDVIWDRDGMYGRFSVYMGKNNIATRCTLLKTAIEAMGFANEFPTIIEADVNCFGLIYHTFFCGKTLDTSHVADLKTQIAAKIEVFKGDNAHSDSPNRVTYIRRRIKGSIDVYSHFVI